MKMTHEKKNKKKKKWIQKIFNYFSIITLRLLCSRLKEELVSVSFALTTHNNMKNE